MKRLAAIAVTVVVIVLGGLWLMRSREAGDAAEAARRDVSRDQRSRLVEHAARPPAPKLIVNKNELLQQDCDDGNLDACETLGRKLWAGWKEPSDPRRALQLFVAACQKDHAESCGHAGGLLYQGKESVVRDHRAALVYLDKACTMGVALACSRAQSIFELGDIPPDPVRAEYYHAKALALGLDDP
jgi:TPR repeat protein